MKTPRGLAGAIAGVMSLVAWASAGASGSWASAGSDQREDEVEARAASLYEEAVKLKRESDPAAKEVFAHAAVLFDSLAGGNEGEGEAEGREATGGTGGNAVLADLGLLRAAAYSYWYAEDAGRAYLYFRRASFRSPFDEGLREGMERAMKAAGNEASPSRRRLEVVASYLEVVPRAARVWGMVGGWTLGWVVLAWRALGSGVSGGRRRLCPPRAIGIACLAVSVLGAGSLLPTEWLLRRDHAAVVVKATAAYSEPSESVGSLAGSEPLKPASEVRVVLRRGEWTCIEAANSDAACWVRSADVRGIFSE
ncbi:MAG: hypothetical protein AB7G11_03665 [Phycisphaerales bacterium]